jgi:hypothetical protein
MKKNGKRNKHFFFCFSNFNFTLTPQHTRKQTASIVVSLSGVFLGGFVYSPPYLRITISSHTCFSFFSFLLFLILILTSACFPVSIFSFLLLRPAIPAPIYFHVCQRCSAIALVVVVDVVCGSCCTRSAGLPLRQLGIASTPIKKWAVREVAGGNSTDERRDSRSAHSHANVRRRPIPVKPKNL